MKLFHGAILAVMLLAGGPGYAVEPGEILDDPALESRAREISKELRCVVCRNQSIDDSDAGLAKDLRMVVRERLVAGDSDDEVMSFVTSRYGEYVLLRPPFSATSAVLYLGGPLLLILGGVACVRVMRSGRTGAVASARTKPLSPEEEARLRRIHEGETDT